MSTLDLEQPRKAIERAIADFQKFLSFEDHWNAEMPSQAEAHIKELTEPE